MVLLLCIFAFKLASLCSGLKLVVVSAADQRSEAPLNFKDKMLARHKRLPGSIGFIPSIRLHVKEAFQLRTSSGWPRKQPPIEKTADDVQDPHAQGLLY